MDWIFEQLGRMELTGWEIFGLAGECFFFARMVAQWLASEKAGKPVIPTVYWYLSILGAIIVAIYALHKVSLVLLLPQVVGSIFYARGWHLDRRERRRIEKTKDSAMTYPFLSVCVPIHNEENGIAKTLDNLIQAAKHYPGKAEIILGLNGCKDNSKGGAIEKGFTEETADSVEGKPALRIVESEESGMSFGKNLAARAALGDIIIFVDADTVIPENGLMLLAKSIEGIENPALTVAGAPDKGGLVVRITYLIANFFCCMKKVHAPSGVMAVSRATFDAIGGLDESLPQGTSTDLLRRAMDKGARFVYVNSFKATTSIRRFEKTGIISQMLLWRKNHRDLKKGNREEVTSKEYKNFR